METETHPAEALASSVKLLAWEPIRGRKLRGRATVLLADALKIKHCLVVSRQGQLTASLPAKLLYGPDGKPNLDPETGSARYENLIYWQSRNIALKFSDAVIAAVVAAHPEVTP